MGLVVSHVEFVGYPCFLVAPFSRLREKGVHAEALSIHNIQRDRPIVYFSTK